MNEDAGSLPPPTSIDEFFARYPCDDRARGYLTSAGDAVVERALREFRPPQEGQRDYSALLVTFVRGLRQDDLSSRLGGGGGLSDGLFGGHGSQDLDPALEAEISRFEQQYPLDESAHNYLVNSPPEVRLAILQDFNPPRQGEGDYSAILISFAKRLRTSWQQGQMAAPSRVGGGIVNADLEEELNRFRERYPLDESATNYLMNSPEEVQWAVLRDFMPNRQGESDYSALLISFTKRRRDAMRQQMQQGFSHSLQQSPQAFMQPPPPRLSGGGGGAHELQAEVDRFLQRYPLDESAFNYLVGSPPQVQWQIVREFSPPSQGQSDYSPLLISFAKRLRQAQQQQQLQAVQMHQQQQHRGQPLMRQGLPMPPQLPQSQGLPQTGARLQAELEKFRQQYPLDESATSYLLNSPAEVQWAVLQDFKPPRQGESDYSALLISFAKRNRTALHNGMHATGSRLTAEMDRLMQQYPLDDSARRYLLTSSPPVQWAVVTSFHPPREGEADYSALLISFTKRQRQQVQVQQAPMHHQQQPPMHHQQQPPMHHQQQPPMHHQQNFRPAPPPPPAMQQRRFDSGFCPVPFAWGGGRPQNRGPPPPQQHQRGPPVDRSSLPDKVREFLSRYPLDDDSLHYLLQSPEDVQDGILRDFKPPREGERDYSALFISFAKRCRTMAAQRSYEDYGSGPLGHAAEGLVSDAELEVFRINFPMDDRAFRYLLESPPEVRRQVVDTFQPKRPDDTDFSPAVTAYAKLCRTRLPPNRVQHGGLEAQVRDFTSRFPCDARAQDMLLELPPEVCERVIREFRPRREGDTDYSAAIVAFIGVCKRSFGMFVGTLGGGPGGGGMMKQPRFR